MMTKKDYELIAQTIHETFHFDIEQTTVETVAINLAAHFARANPKFNRARFLAACGVSK